MSTTVERLVAEPGKLPLAELREVWQRVGIPLDKEVPPHAFDEHAALEAINSLCGCFAGGKMADRLLDERARDRSSEEEKLRRS